MSNSPRLVASVAMRCPGGHGRRAFGKCLHARGVVGRFGKFHMEESDLRLLHGLGASLRLPGLRLRLEAVLCGLSACQEPLRFALANIGSPFTPAM